MCQRMHRTFAAWLLSSKHGAPVSTECVPTRAACVRAGSRTAAARSVRVEHPTLLWRNQLTERFSSTEDNIHMGALRCAAR
jgi:hypothetical protein